MNWTLCTRDNTSAVVTVGNCYPGHQHDATMSRGNKMLLNKQYNVPSVNNLKNKYRKKIKCS